MSDRQRPLVLSDGRDDGEPGPGDFYLSPDGTWRVAEDGRWRPFDELTADELTLLDILIRLGHVEEALAPFSKAAAGHGLRKASKDDLWVSLGIASSAWARASSL